MGNLSLDNLINNYKRNHSIFVKSSGSYNEHSCRVEFIDPFLEILGWDVSNSRGMPPQFREIIAENYTKEIGKPDYTLTLCGVPKFFIEAKKPSVNITDEFEPAFQARKYGWNGGHKIVVLTNFEDLLIYDAGYAPSEHDSPDVALIRHYHYTEYVEKLDEIKLLLSRHSVYSGEHDAYLSKILHVSSIPKKTVDEEFLSQINEWRVRLSNYLYHNSGYKDIETLNDVVQVFINQIVFLRICEDRNLPLYHKLAECNNPKTIKDELAQLISESEKRYNSGIFSGNNILFDLDNKIISDIISKLYFPNSIYQFNIIEPNLLGKIYEQFLTERLIIDDMNNLVLSEKTECVDRSIVTTPTEIVKYIVSSSLTPLCENKTPADILNIKIADICCGSGVFLEEAYDFLVKWCVNWYLANEPDYLIPISENILKLPLADKKKILSSCIYGIDVDIHAVEVAKFSLLIKLIEDETAPSVSLEHPILPNLDCNIVFGNSLIEPEHLSRNTPNDVYLKIAPFDWNNINNGEKFDAIIGNPPYVNTEGMISLVHQAEFEIYKRKYTSSYKQFDKYFLFIERGLEKIKSDGYLSYIVPNKFFTNVAGKELRNIIASEKCVIRIDDFASLQLFGDKTIYSTIITLSRKNLDTIEYTQPPSITALLTGHTTQIISYPSDILLKDTWVFTTDNKFLEMYEKLEKNKTYVSDFVDFVNGIQTSAERPPVYWFSLSDRVGEDADTYTFRDGDKKVKIEKSILRPYFKPIKPSEKKIGTYDILKTDKVIIFPYNMEGELIDYDSMQTSYPNTLAYLRSHYDKLLPKELGGNRDVSPATGDSTTWYRYGRSQALTVFNNTKKLIVGVMRKDNPMYIYDSQNMLISSGGTAGYCAVIKKKESPYELEYIQAWLTHPYTQSIIKVIGSHFKHGFSSNGTAVLKKLPFAKLDFTNEIQKNQYDSVVQMTREIYNINDMLCSDLTKKDEIILIRKKEDLMKKIENIISNIYNSTDVS